MLFLLTSFTYIWRVKILYSRVLQGEGALEKYTLVTRQQKWLQITKGLMVLRRVGDQAWDFQFRVFLLYYQSPSGYTRLRNRKLKSIISKVLMFFIKKSFWVHVEHENVHAYHVLNFFLCILHGHGINAFFSSAVAFNFQAYAHMQCALKIINRMLCLSLKIS